MPEPGDDRALGDDGALGALLAELQGRVLAEAGERMRAGLDTTYIRNADQPARWWLFKLREASTPLRGWLEERDVRTWLVFLGAWALGAAAAIDSRDERTRLEVRLASRASTPGGGE